MDELVSVMMEIRDQLAELNRKIDGLTGQGVYDLRDVCSKLDTIDSSLSGIDSTIMMKD